MNRATKSDSWAQNPDGTPGFTSSPITGCLKRCPYCFAQSLANGRLKPRYLQNFNIPEIYMCEGIVNKDQLALQHLQDPFYPRFWPTRLYEIERHKKPAGIFLNIMGDWAGDCIPQDWQDRMFATIWKCPQHRFYTLTKQAQNLPKFSPFPDNVYVGVSVTCDGDMQAAYEGLDCIMAKVKFLSFEPLLGPLSRGNLELIAYPYHCWLDWVIIGAMTCVGADLARLSALYPELTPTPYGNRYVLLPKLEWVNKIVRYAAMAGTAVFMKENLTPLVGELRQAQPKAARRL